MDNQADQGMVRLRNHKHYWEHAGLMSNPEYVSDFVWKNNLYYENHLLPGTDVLFTFETEDHPLEIRMIKNMILNLLT